MQIQKKEHANDNKNNERDITLTGATLKPELTIGFYEGLLL